MKKIVALAFFSLLLTVTLGSFAYAQVPPTTIPTTITSTADVQVLVTRIINWIFFFFLTVAIVFIILAGLQFVTAGGDAAKVGEARMKLIYAAVGIGIALLARGIAPVMRNLLSGL